MNIKTIIIVLASLMIAVGALANNRNFEVNHKVQISFQAKFADASEITWSKTSNYLKASFRLEKQYMFAYYKENGELLAVSRNMLTTHLPIALRDSLKRQYSREWISELFEFSTDEQTFYLAVVENGDEKLTIKSSDGRRWELAERVRKP